MSDKRVHADINLKNIKYNFNKISKNLPEEVLKLAVIKADAYGHGSYEIAKYLANDADFFAVATAEEALTLTEAGIKTPILILGYVWPEDYGSLIKAGIRFPVFKYSDALAVSKTAEIIGKEAIIHIKVDTGMHRIGFEVNEENAEIVKKIKALPGINAEGIFTHFARADEADKSYTYEQFESFKRFISLTENDGKVFKIHHCANSAASMELPDLAMDMVRIGIALYGMYPSSEVSRKLKLKTALSMRSEIVYLKKLEKGAGIGYNHTEYLGSDAIIATVPVGYADGYPRLLSGKADVLVRGKRARIVGRICMDQLMIDVTNIPGVKEGDVVTLIGSDEKEEITVDELAGICGRFNYEFVCEINPRTKRIYRK